MKHTLISDNLYFTGIGFTPGTLVFENDKILKVSKKIEKNFTIDARGYFVYPGLIDPHSHIGLDEMESGVGMSDTNEFGNFTAAELRASDGVFPRDPAFKDAIAAGVTTVGVFPGSANAFGGQGVAIHTTGRTIDEMKIKDQIGMKMALGENVKNLGMSTKKGPVTRMGIAALIRNTFLKADQYRKNKKKERNLNLEAIAGLLNGDYPARIHAHRDDDILTAVRLAEEFNFPYYIEHASSSHLIMDIMAEKKVSLTIGPSKSVKRKIECRDKSFQTVLIAHQFGVPFTITMDHPVISIDMLPVTAALICKEGLDRNVMLDALTVQAAKTLGLADTIGQFKKGFLADFVISKGHPLEVGSSTVKAVYINGVMQEVNPL